MKIYDCKNDLSEGTLHTVPLEFYSFLSPWADTEYRKYSFGTFLKQKLEHRNFRLLICHLTIEKPAHFQIVRSPGIAFLATLTGSEHVCKMELPETDHVLLKPLGPNPVETFCEPATVEWMECVWTKPHEHADPSEMEEYFWILNSDDAEYKNRIMNSQVRMNFIIKVLINRIRHSSITGARLHQEVSFCITELLSEYSNSLKESIQLCRVCNKETIAAINQEIKEDPNIHRSIRYFMKKYHLSRNVLQENFLRSFGISLPDYVERECMKNAEYLLYNTNNTLDDIAFQFGYATTGNFKRAFKRYFDCNPRESRNIKR